MLCKDFRFLLDINPQTFKQKAMDLSLDIWRNPKAAKKMTILQSISINLQNRLLKAN